MDAHQVDQEPKVSGRFRRRYPNAARMLAFAGGASAIH
jgi:hypothetical protein